MYNVSENYINAVRAKTRSDRLLCTLTFPDDVEHPVSLTDADYGEGSISIEWQSVDGDELMFGSAIAASMTISLRTSVNRYRFYGATIVPVYQVKTGTNTWESVPLGIFTVTDAERVGSLVNITAIDNMQALDLAYGSAVLQGTAYEVLQAICEDVGLTLGMSSSDMTGWPNTETIIQIDITNGCSTYRDALKGVCQLVGAFAIIDRAGQLVLKQFHTTKDLTLGRTDRYNSTIADYTCNYVGLSVTGMGGTYTKESQSDESGLIMFIKDAIGWDPVNEDNLLKYRTNSLFTYLETIEYTPSDFEMPGDPSLECGDMIELVLDADGEETVNTILTSVDWSYRKPMSLESVGQNPFLSGAVGSVDKSNRILSLQGEQNKVVMYTFRNSSDKTVGSTDENICRLAFATMGATDTLFYATVLLEVTPNNPETNFVDSTGANVSASAGKVIANFTYLLNNEEVLYHPTQVLTAGKHAFVLFFPIQNLLANLMYTWQVLLNVEGGTVKILKDDLRAILWGQNLVAAGVPWDGLLEILENISPITIPATQITVHNITDVVSLATNSSAYKPAITEGLPIVSFSNPSITVTDVSEELTVGRMVLYFTINTSRAGQYSYNRSYVKIVNDEFSLNESYPFLSHADTIDTGALKTCDVETSTMELASLEGLGVVASGESGGGGVPSYARLPRGYKELQYIENTSAGPWIDTGITPDTDTVVYVKLRPLEITGNVLFGYYSGNDQTDWRLFNYSGTCYFDLPGGGGQEGRRISGSQLFANQDYFFELGNFYVKNANNGVSILSGSSASYTGARSLTLGNYNNTAFAMVRWYYVGIYSGATKVAELIPCKREYDNAIGMYDLVSDSFIENSGSGAYAGGNLVELPDTYQQVEYIKSTGTQYITTPAMFMPIDDVETEFSYDGSDKQDKYPISAQPWGSSIQRRYAMGVHNGGQSNPYFTCGYGNTGTSTTYLQPLTLADALMHKWTYKNKIFKIEDLNISRDVSSISYNTGSNNYVYLFYGEAGTNESTIKYYKHFRNGVAVVNLIPCYRKADDVIGMYDVANGVFYTNAGSGTFLKGADITPSAGYRTLITDGTNVYSISNGALTASVGLLTNLSATMFQTYGFEQLSDCTDAEDDILAFADFSILRWCGDDTDTSTMVATVSAIPDSQHIVTPTFSITDSGITGIELVTTDTDGSPQASIKFDNGNWEYYDTIDEGWYEVGQGSRGYMTVADLEDLTEQIWADKLDGVNTMQTRFTLPTRNDTVAEIQYKFLNE